MISKYYAFPANEGGMEKFTVDLTYNNNNG